MKHELRYLQAREMRATTAADGSRSISGIVSYNSLSVDLGGFREIIAPGAFADSLDDVLCLRDHKPTLLMGRTKSGTLTLTDSDEGLEFRCALPKTSTANDLAESIDRKDLDGVSFGFACEKDDWKMADDGTIVRTVIKAELFEISPCSFAAYPENSVSIRSCPSELRKKVSKSKRDSGCMCDCDNCQNGDCADCTNSDCQDPECSGSMRSQVANAEERSRLEMTIELTKRS